MVSENIPELLLPVKMSRIDDKIFDMMVKLVAFCVENRPDVEDDTNFVLSYYVTKLHEFF